MCDCPLRVFRCILELGQRGEPTLIHMHAMEVDNEVGYRSWGDRSYMSFHSAKGSKLPSWPSLASSGSPSFHTDLDPGSLSSVQGCRRMKCLGGPCILVKSWMVSLEFYSCNSKFGSISDARFVCNPIFRISRRNHCYFPLLLI